MIVVDTNIIAYLHITGKFTPLVIQLIEKDSNWIAPPLWQSEFRNVLINTIRHNLMTLEQGIELLNDALLTMQNREIPPSSELVLSLGANSKSSSYDCEFVALAKETSSYLVTADHQLSQNFPETAIRLEDFVA
jgi:predicted nucleic acid-binding protein